MMKRLLVLAMVLAVAPCATAVLSISVDPNPIPLGVSLLLEINADGTDLDPTFMLIVDNAYGSISNGVTGNVGDFPSNESYYVTYAWDPDLSFLAYASLDPAQYNGIAWILSYNFPDISLSGIVFEEIEFRFEDGVESATVQLWNSPDWGSTWVLDDTMTVVPEPLTMALLGLGGLFLRRRK